MTDDRDNDQHIEPRRSDVQDLDRRLAQCEAELASLRESEQLFRALVESAQDFIFVLDRQGVVRYVNTFGAQALRRQPADCVGLVHAELFPSNADRQRESVDQVFATGAPLHVETVTEFPSGALCLDTWLAPVRGSRGEVDLVLGISRDITERKHAIEALKHRIAFEETIAGISRRFINLPTDRIDVAIREGLQTLGRFIGADRCTIRLIAHGGPCFDLAYEWQHPEVDGIRSRATIAVEQLPWGMRALQAFEPLLLTSLDDLPSTAVGERALLESLGIVSLAMVPLVYAGALTGVLTFASVRSRRRWSRDTVALLAIAGEVFSNALARKRAEDDIGKMAVELERVERIESIGILAGGIAHDFNNILAAIWGNLSLARTTLAVDSMAHARLLEAEKGLQRAKDLTQQLLTFARGGSPVKSIVETGPVVEESAAFATRGSNVRAETFIAPGLWPIEADRGQIAQVLHNLVINAVQAMPSGGTVRVHADNVSVPADLVLPIAAGAYVRIRVVDHGEGISAEHKPKLFVPYFTTKKGGSGLGLATSYNIVRKHAGIITVDSSPGSGSTFTVYLPASPGSSVAGWVEEPAMARGTGRVLVVDNEEAIRQTTSAMLRYLGYEPESAADGRQAVEMYRTALDQGSPFAAVLMDLTIPGSMGGTEAVQRILAIDGAARVIVSSGYANDPVMIDYRRYGFHGAIRKPYGIRELGTALETLLSRP
jgi:PAS domain S-box-containing protein